MKKIKSLSTLLVILAMSFLGGVSSYAEDDDTQPDSFGECFKGCKGNPDLSVAYCVTVCGCYEDVGDIDYCREKAESTAADRVELPPDQPNPFIKYFENVSPSGSAVNSIKK